jgi:hypothetical protein
MLVIEEFLESSLSALEEAIARKKHEEENTSMKTTPATKTAEKSVVSVYNSSTKQKEYIEGTENAPLIIVSSPEDSEDTFELTEDPDTPVETSDVDPQPESAESAESIEFDKSAKAVKTRYCTKPTEINDLTDEISDIFGVPTKNIVPVTTDASAKFAPNEQTLSVEPADKSSEPPLSDKQAKVDFVLPGESDVSSEPLFDEPVERDVDILTSSLSTVSTANADFKIHSLKESFIKSNPEDSILATGDFEPSNDDDDDTNRDKEEDEEEEEEDNSRIYWSNTCNFTSIQTWLMDGVVAKIKDNEAQMVASSNG